jgi:hypothetical protein
MITTLATQMQRHMQQARLHNEATGDSILTPQQQMQFFQQQYAQQQPSNMELHKALGPSEPTANGRSSDWASNTSNVVQRRKD